MLIREELYGGGQINIKALCCLKKMAATKYTKINEGEAEGIQIEGWKILSLKKHILKAADMEEYVPDYYFLF
jgi:hypothetical protein